MQRQTWTSKKLRRTLTVALTSLAIISPSSIVYAQGRPRKLTIYDEPQPEIILVEPPTRLENATAKAQKYLCETTREAQNQLESVTNKWISVEQCVERTIKETVSPDEDVLPNGLYVGVAALAGTIAARNRGFILRATTPLVFTVGASYYFLPKTTCNVGTRLSRLEARFPAFQSARKSMADSAKIAQGQIEETVSQLKGVFVPEKQETPQVQDVSPIEEVKEEIKMIALVEEEQVEKKVDPVVEKIQEMYSTRVKPELEDDVLGKK